MDNRDLRRQLHAIRRQLRRNQLYLALALAVIGVGTLVAVGLIGYYGLRLSAQVDTVAARLEISENDSRTRSKALSLDLARQHEELSAIRKAAGDDLRSIQEAHRRLSQIRDPGQELTALRDANEALWSELATQRQELLGALSDPPEEPLEPAEPLPMGRRFELGETNFLDAGGERGRTGFLAETSGLQLASTPPPNPGYLIIELSPEAVRLGEPYRLEVRLVNRSNRPLSPQALRLDWSFDGMNSGGAVPLTSTRVDPQENAVLYDVAGRWTPAHEKGPVVLTATVTLDSGGRLANSLSW